MDLLDPFDATSPYCLSGKVSSRSDYIEIAAGNSDIWTGFIDGQKVAIKVLRYAFGKDMSANDIQKVRRKLWREYITWSSLSHPNIAPFLGFTHDYVDESRHGLPALISPWMDNGTVLDYVVKAKGQNQPVDLLNLILGITRGVTYLHTQQDPIVHGDLRCGNILVNDAGIPCLTDFGLSRVVKNTIGVTTTSIGGTAPWMPPELFQRNGKFSLWSDVWSFGMTLLELITHKRPYADIENEPATIHEICGGGLPKKPEEIPNDKIWNLCCQCWAKQPNKRPSMTRIANALWRHVHQIPSKGCEWTDPEFCDCFLCGQILAPAHARIAFYEQGSSHLSVPNPSEGRIPRAITPPLPLSPDTSEPKPFDLPTSITPAPAVASWGNPSLSINGSGFAATEVHLSEGHTEPNLHLPYTTIHSNAAGMRSDHSASPGNISAPNGLPAVIIEEKSSEPKIIRPISSFTHDIDLRLTIPSTTVPGTSVESLLEVENHQPGRASFRSYDGILGIVALRDTSGPDTPASDITLVGNQHTIQATGSKFFGKGGMGNNKGNLALAAISEDPEEDRVLERRKETNLTKESHFTGRGGAGKVSHPRPEGLTEKEIQEEKRVHLRAKIERESNPVQIVGGGRGGVFRRMAGDERDTSSASGRGTVGGEEIRHIETQHKPAEQSRKGGFLWFIRSTFCLAPRDPQ